MKVSNVSFNGNYLIKYPSEKARDVSELHINFDRKYDQFIFCRSIGKDKLHYMTGKDGEDWKKLVDACKQSPFTLRLSELYDIIDKHFLENAIPIDFSNVKSDENFMNDYLVKFIKKDPKREYIPTKRAIALLPDELKELVLKKTKKSK